MHSKELWFKVRFLSHKLKGNPVVSDGEIAVEYAETIHYSQSPNDL